LVAPETRTGRPFQCGHRTNNSVLRLNVAVPPGAEPRFVLARRNELVHPAVVVPPSSGVALEGLAEAVPLHH
jgi:hypothetical protein